MATLNVIRRWALRDQMSIREISRRTGLARNTVKKYLRSDETEPSYERRVSSSKLDPYAEKLATWLGIEATKSRKQRRTLRPIHTIRADRRPHPNPGARRAIKQQQPRPACAAGLQSARQAGHTVSRIPQQRHQPAQGTGGRHASGRRNSPGAPDHHGIFAQPGAKGVG